MLVLNYVQEYSICNTPNRKNEKSIHIRCRRKSVSLLLRKVKTFEICSHLSDVSSFKRAEKFKILVKDKVPKALRALNVAHFDSVGY